MTDLRDHEDVLRSGLRKLEPHTRFAEVMSETNSGESVEADSKSNTATRPARMSGAAFRAWAGDRWVEGATSSFGASAVKRAVDGLLDLLRASTAPGPPPGVSATTVGTHVESPARPMEDLDTEQILQRVAEIKGWASGVPRIKISRAGVRWNVNERQYLNTAGANCFQRVPRTHFVVVAVAGENGKTQVDADIAGAIGGQEVLDGVTEENVRAMAQSAVALLDAKAAPTGRMDVILDPGVAATFAHESFGHGTEGDQFVRKRSYLEPLLGQTVGPDFLTLVDDGSIAGAWGSVFFDDEGHPGARTVLIDHGRFVSGLYDRESAAAYNAQPTGNTRRASFLDRAFVRMTNTIVEPGDRSFEELVHEVKHGVVLERWTSGMEDPAGGQMQIKVGRGHRIENGQLTDLVGPMALSGRVLEFLRDVRGIGSRKDFEMTPGFCGKGHGDYLPVGDGGSYVLSQAVVGPT